jgi:hypothetical protein
MSQLKGVIFSLRDVVVKSGKMDAAIFEEFKRLVLWLVASDLRPVFVGNQSWTITSVDGTKIPFQEYVTVNIGEFDWFMADSCPMPYKPQKASMEYVLNELGWEKHEAVYVGNTETDMKTARNAGLLFLNALWHGEANDYGFKFDGPKDIARFIDCFYIGVHGWFWALEDKDLQVYSLAPFSTMSARYTDAHGFSHHARNTAKSGGGDPIFWGRLLASSVYSSGLAESISFVTSYPGHSTNSPEPSVNTALTIFADCMQAKFIPDLLVRHTTAQKSQNARIAGKTVGVKNQIDTIHLNPAPLKTKKEDRYKSPPLKNGKTVLIVDDFCTQGNSFEAARAYISATGANVLCLSWLKTINTDYMELKPMVTVENPYVPNTIADEPTKEAHWFSNHVANPAATSDLSVVFHKYYNWDWP